MPRNWAFLTDILSQHIFFDNGRNFLPSSDAEAAPWTRSLLLLTLTNPALNPKPTSGFWALTDGPRLSAGCLPEAEAWSHGCDGSSLFLAHPLNISLLSEKWGRRWNLPGFFHYKLCPACNLCVHFFLFCGLTCSQLRDSFKMQKGAPRQCLGLQSIWQPVRNFCSHLLLLMSAKGLYSCSAERWNTEEICSCILNIFP